jgi:hypothetical protein
VLECVCRCGGQCVNRRDGGSDSGAGGVDVEEEDEVGWERGEDKGVAGRGGAEWDELDIDTSRLSREASSSSEVELVDQ